MLLFFLFVDLIATTIITETFFFSLVNKEYTLLTGGTELDKPVVLTQCTEIVDVFTATVGEGFLYHSTQLSREVAGSLDQVIGYR